MPPLRKNVHFYTDSFMNESVCCYGLLCVSVCVCVCNVRESYQELLTEDLPVWRIICSIHLVIRHTKPEKKILQFSFSFQVPNVDGVWKIMKMSHSMIDNSAVWNSYTAVRFSLLDRACRVVHLADTGFSKTGYSPVLLRLKTLKCTKYAL
jgi:hypothetical protein